MIDFKEMVLDCVRWDSVGSVTDGSCGHGGEFCDRFLPMQLVICGYFTVKSNPL